MSDHADARNQAFFKDQGAAIAGDTGTKWPD